MNYEAANSRRLDDLDAMNFGSTLFKKKYSCIYRFKSRVKGKTWRMGQYSGRHGWDDTWIHHDMHRRA